MSDFMDEINIRYNFPTAHRSCPLISQTSESIVSLIWIAVKIIVGVTTLGDINETDAVFCTGGNNIFD